MTVSTPLPAPPATRRRRARHFARHYAEMLVAMIAGMAVLGIPIEVALGAVGAGDAAVPMLLGMAVSMTVPMVAWMRHRGHAWAPCLEMAAAMVVPTLAAIGVHAVGAATLDTVLVAEHVVMLAAMAGVMLLRPAEYCH